MGSKGSHADDLMSPERKAEQESSWRAASRLTSRALPENLCRGRTQILVILIYTDMHVGISRALKAYREIAGRREGLHVCCGNLVLITLVSVGGSQQGGEHWH